MTILDRIRSTKTTQPSATIIGFVAATILALSCALSWSAPSAFAYARNYGADNVITYIDDANEQASGIEATFATNDQLSRQAAGSSEATALADATDELPSSYQFTDLPIRDQGLYSICWSFATTACIEASAIQHGLTDASIDLSEFQLAYFAFNNRDVADPLGLIAGDYNYTPSGSYLDGGAHQENIMWVAAAWYGATTEENAPLSPYDQNMYTTTLDDSLAFDCDSIHVNGVQVIPFTKRDSIKQAVLSDGGVEVGFTADLDYFNYDNDCFYDSDDLDTNHLVTIVGWDDSFAKENFSHTIYKKDGNGNYIYDDQWQPVADKIATASTTPKNDGAWLVKNSWGGTWNDDFNPCGYFWLSYDNYAFSGYASTGYAFSVESADVHDHNYQYDGTGSDSRSFCAAKGYIANVYTASGNPGGHEVLDAISIGLASTQVSYSVQIYAGLTDPANPTSGTAMLDEPVTGTTGLSGLVTIPLNQEVLLEEGQTFSVVFTNTGTRAINYYAENSSSGTSTMRCHAQIDAGQSFYQSGKTWQDLAQTTSPCCARIKAYTSDASGTIHHPVDSAPVPATCTTTGTIGGVHCAVCGEVLTAPETTPALGHAFVGPEATNSGQKMRCSRCGLSTKAYSDVPATGIWYSTSIYTASLQGLFTGYPDGTFRPGQTLTRAQIVTILWRYFAPDAAAAYDVSTATNTTNLPDVEDHQWYTEAANWAVSTGIINGEATAHGCLFDPYGNTTRDMACTMVARAACVFAKADIAGASHEKLNAMPDADQVESWATDAVAWCLDRGVISGKKVNGVCYIDPLTSTTRAEAATIMTNADAAGLLKSA